MNHNEIIAKYKYIGKKFENYKDFISSKNYHKISNFPIEFERKLMSNIKRNEALKIGIVGQVKAGKSSFINAMLFGGDEILPKAATPMTASLTKISYAEDLRAEIYFYSQVDWKIIEKNAQEYRELLSEYIEEAKNNHYKTYAYSEATILEFNREGAKKIFDKEVDEVLKACNELVQSAEKNFDILDYLDSEKKIIEGVEKLEDLNHKLMKYVGANGKYTPIVKSISIFLDIPELKGLDIIDTPGTNDPVISRGIETKKHLAECDLALLLSYSSQFMTNSDYNFIRNNLPNSGINRAYLIASKFDSALLDYNKNRGNLKAAHKEVRKDLYEHAKNVIDKGLKKEPNNKILQNIKNNFPPAFVSSMCYEIGKKMPYLNSEQEHILKKLQQYYGNGEPFKTSDLIELANIERTKEKCFSETRRDKDEILKNKLKDLMLGQNSEFVDILIETKDKTQDLMNKLKTMEIDEINKKYTLINDTLKNIHYSVRDIFSDLMFSAEKELNELKLEIKEAKSGKFYKNIEIHLEYEKKIYTEGWLFWKQEREKTVTKKIASINDAIDNSDKFITEIHKKIGGITDKLINKKNLENKLKQSINDIFKLSRKNLSAEEIIVPLKEAINGIIIPNINLENNEYMDIITKEFSSVIVKEYEIEELKRCQTKVLDKITIDTEKKIDEFKKEMLNNLKIISNTFIENLQEKLTEEKEILISKAKDKENSLKNYGEVINQINEAMKNLKLGDL